MSCDQLAGSGMSWPGAERFLDALDANARSRLLRLLESPDDMRAEMIGRLHLRNDGADLEELPILLEEKESARQWFIERLRWDFPGKVTARAWNRACRNQEAEVPPSSC